MDQLRRDLGFAIRMLLKHPGLSVIIIVTLALGIGMTTTVFSLVNGVAFKGLPFPGLSVELVDAVIPHEPGTGPRPEHLLLLVEVEIDKTCLAVAQYHVDEGYIFLILRVLSGKSEGKPQ